MPQKTHPVHLLISRLQFSSALKHDISQFLLCHQNKRKVMSQKINLSKVFPRTSFLSNFWFVFYISKLLQQVPNTPSVITSVSFWIYKTITGNDHCSLLSSFFSQNSLIFSPYSISFPIQIVKFSHLILLVFEFSNRGVMSPKKPEVPNDCCVSF